MSEQANHTPRFPASEPKNPPGVEQAIALFYAIFDCLKDLEHAHGEDCRCELCCEAAGMHWTMEHCVACLEGLVIGAYAQREGHFCQKILRLLERGHVSQEEAEAIREDCERQETAKMIRLAAEARARAEARKAKEQAQETAAENPFYAAARR